MPEGDTIHQIAATLRKVLEGKPVIELRSLQGAIDLSPDLCVSEVRAVGKNLLIGLSNGRWLHTHLGMTGSWHTYPRADRRSHNRASVAIGVHDAVALCYAPRVARWLDSSQVDALVASSGPDLIDDRFSMDEAVQRLRGVGNAPIGVALIDQRVLAGIGNVYKSEVLFLCGVDPFRPSDRVGEEDLRKLVTTARAALRAHRHPGQRRRLTAQSAPRSLWVYGRSGQPCLRCGSTIQMGHQGSPPRSTYYCPGCQKGDWLPESP